MATSAPLAVSGVTIPTFFTVSASAARYLPFSFLGKFWGMQLLFVGSFLGIALGLSLLSWLFQRLRLIWVKL
jgi:hypothetical protein